MILFVAFACLSDWGWNVDDIQSLTPAKEKCSFQKLLVKTGHDLLLSSLVFHEALPPHWRIHVRPMWPYKGDPKVCSVLPWRIYWPMLGSLTRGNPSTKSIAISAQMVVGISRGYRRPTGCKCSVLFCWQVTHARTWSWMSLWVPGTWNVMCFPHPHGRDHEPKIEWLVATLTMREHTPFLQRWSDHPPLSIFPMTPIVYFLAKLLQFRIRLLFLSDLIKQAQLRCKQCRRGRLYFRITSGKGAGHYVCCSWLVFHQKIKPE
jgi:hypothetical protein